MTTAVHPSQSFLFHSWSFRRAKERERFMHQIPAIPGMVNSSEKLISGKLRIERSCCGR